MEKKILLIDDDEDITRSFKVILENQNYIVSSANNARDGMEKLNSGKPDLLILDIMMATDLEGYGMAYDVKGNPELKDIPILVISGMKDSLGVNFAGAVEEVDALPNVHFLHKPIEQIKLIDTVSELLSSD